LSNVDGDFPTALRGYDKGAVDDAIRDLRRDLLTVSAQNAQLAAELRETTNKLNEATAQLQEVGEPSYAGVGAKAALILSTSEEMSARLLGEATAERNRILAETHAQIEELHGEAKGYYDALVAEAQRRTDRMMSQGRVEIDDLQKQAHDRAAFIVDEANREAGATRGATATEVAKIRAAARRDAETLKTKTERDLAERKLLAMRDNTRELDMARAEELIGEQARIDLELEITARRAEAEAEYLRKHQEAVATTQRYLDDANQQLAIALTRANAARLEAETLEAAARSITKTITDNAKAKSEALIAQAEAEARNILSEATLKTAVQLRDAEAQLQNIKTERDAVSVYLKNLKALVDSAYKVDKQTQE
jgi:cell division septum initiation protein DivIVA